MALTIWCNTKLVPAAAQQLVEGAHGHRVIWAATASASVLAAGQADQSLQEADIAFGQPPVDDCFSAKKLQWIQLSTAGYTRYDREDFKEALKSRGAKLTNASSVFAEPCAQHVLAMMLALGRNILPSYQAQLGDHGWHYEKRRYHSRLLTGQTVLMLGFGAIGRRLAELLTPFHMTLMAVRRQTRSERAVRIIPEGNISASLGEADHVINLLPENDVTRHYVNARRLSCFKPGAKFYNVGRGATVDQEALLDALASARLGAAYLDVTEPEPLPPEHRLWTAPNCFITPHTAGGRHDQDEALAQLFIANLTAFETGRALIDRVV
jgi:phosphoglycerate dehydrogenase-like enzyme